VQEHTTSAQLPISQEHTTSAQLPISQEHDSVGYALETFLAEFNYVHRRPASGSSAVPNRRVIKKRRGSSSKITTDIVWHLTRHETTVPQVITEGKTRRTSAAYKRMQLFFFCITRKAIINEQTTIFQSNPTALPWSISYLKPLLTFFQYCAKPRTDRVLNLFTVFK
jgi:hypothetical protein